MKRRVNNGRGSRIAGRRRRGTSRAPIGVLIAVELYLTVTFLGYVWGPLAFPDLVTPWLVVAVAGYQTAFAIGYLLSHRPPVRPGPDLSTGQPWTWVRRSVVVGCATSVLLSIVSIATTTGTWSLLNMAEEVLAAAQDPGTAYRANFGNGSNEGSFATAATTALSPLTFAASVVGLATWSRHSWPVRVLLLGELCLQGASALVRGQNLGFFKIAVVVVAVLVVRYAGPAAEPRKRRQIAAVVMGIVTAAITYFAVNTSDRFSSDLPAVVGGVPIDYDAGVMHLVPDGLQLPVVLLFSYLSQGYHGLRQAITMPFHSTWGMGSSRFLMQNLEGMLGIEVEGRTYIHRMDSVWEESNRWHTAYTWFANDVSPWGVVVVMVAIGWLTGRVLTCALRGELVGVVLLPLVILGVVFLPANTLVLSNPLTCMPLLVWGALFVTGQVATSQSWARSRCGSLLTEATPIGAASVRRHYAWRRGMSR